MTVLIAIPIYRISCRVGIDKGRRWSVMEEMVLWAMTRQSKTVAALVDETRLPRQIVVAAIARLMRFRLVEVTVFEGGAAFRASAYGFKAISSGKPLPVFPKRYNKPVSFVIECISGEFYPSRGLTIMAEYRLDLERSGGAEIRKVGVEGGVPSMSNEVNLRRLSDIAARGWNEEVAVVDGRTVDVREDEFLIVRVIDGVARGLPETAGAILRNVVAEAAALPAGTGEMLVGYAGEREEADSAIVMRPCFFDLSDLVIGGIEQRDLFLDLLGKAQRRMIIHSTFLDPRRFEVFMDALRTKSGVTVDLFWGAERDEETEERNSKAATAIAKLVREDPELRGRFRVHMRSTGSHAKLIFLDTEEGWTAAVGSCNWLSSPFESIEFSVVLRDSLVLADLAIAIQRLIGRRGLADSVATEMALIARDLRRVPAAGGTAHIGVVAGEAHDQLIRMASGVATKRFFVGCHRLGSTARPGALMLGEVAAERSGVTATVLYNQPSGPLKNRHARALVEEAAANGVRLVKARTKTLHGKIVAWSDDDVIVTSLNWASAASNLDFPWADIGVHVSSSGLAAAAVAQLERIFPELTERRTAPVAQTGT